MSNSPRKDLVLSGKDYLSFLQSRVPVTNLMKDIIKDCQEEVAHNFRILRRPMLQLVQEKTDTQQLSERIFNTSIKDWKIFLIPKTLNIDNYAELLHSTFIKSTHQEVRNYFIRWQTVALFLSDVVSRMPLNDIDNSLVLTILRIFELGPKLNGFESIVDAHWSFISISDREGELREIIDALVCSGSGTDMAKISDSLIDVISDGKLPNFDNYYNNILSLHRHERFSDDMKEIAAIIHSIDISRIGQVQVPFAIKKVSDILRRTHETESSFGLPNIVLDYVSFVITDKDFSRENLGFEVEIKSHRLFPILDGSHAIDFLSIPGHRLFDFLQYMDTHDTVFAPNSIILNSSDIKTGIDLANAGISPNIYSSLTAQDTLHIDLSMIDVAYKPKYFDHFVFRTPIEIFVSPTTIKTILKDEWRSLLPDLEQGVQNCYISKYTFIVGGNLNVLLLVEDERNELFYERLLSYPGTTLVIYD